MCGKCNNIKALHSYYKYCPYCGEQIRTDEELENKILENKRDIEERKNVYTTYSRASEQNLKDREPISKPRPRYYGKRSRT